MVLVSARWAFVLSGLFLVSSDDVRLTRPGNLDRFNYGETDTSGETNTYGPRDWGRVRCANLEVCQGWHDKFEEGVEWELDENHCRWCPAGTNRCGTHHQSPIDLQRNRAIIGHEFENECIDVHWMSYHDSTCEFEDMVEQNSFTVERHALKVIQPIQDFQNGTYRIGCRNKLGRRWGKIDFSKGFSQWWHLSHIDFKVPSEHTQEGHRYSGELQMYHFYSVSGQDAGVNNEMAAVSVFLEAYDDTPDYDVLNRIICQWRRNEEQTRSSCGLPSITAEYPGCYFYSRGHNEEVAPKSGVDGSRNLRGMNEEQALSKPTPMSAHDIIMHNAHHMKLDESYEPKRIVMDEDDYKDENDFDWDAFIQEQYEREEEAESANLDGRHRRLMNYDHVGPWFNYFPLIGCKTEYYYRYGGTQTIPPCYGQFMEGGNRAQTNNWRMMKDPIRISKRQLNEMHRLLRRRIAPPDDPINPCQRDTAGKPHPDDSNKVWVARPLQSNHKAHHKTFCECQDWGSKWREDKQWCRIKSVSERFFDNPYNYEHEGF